METDHVFKEIFAILSSNDSDQQKTDKIRDILNRFQTLSFKSVRELTNYSFVVPDYQRGYKWKKQQVEDLLNDILSFTSQNPASDQFYCLQPIIVKQQGSSHTWEVIDGQQRLTTIYLICKYLGIEPFPLDYNTRDESRDFLNKLTHSSFEAPEKEMNIDIHFFTNAMKTIISWFDRPDSDKKTWIKAFLDRTKVIWYAPLSSLAQPSASEEIDLFSRINSGKIPLTNSELIRAMLIYESRNQEKGEQILLQQSKIASEWDFIEQQLMEENFWCFVTLGNPFKNKTYANRIESLFDLVELKESGPSKADDTYSTFRLYSKKLSIEQYTAMELWKDIKNLFYRFNEWYTDRDLYHLTGFARLAEIKLTTQELLDQANQFKQSELIQHIKAQAKQSLFKENITKTIKETEYGNADLYKILLLFNVALAIQNGSSAFFDFLSFQEDSWDIEHIRSQTPESDTKKWCEAIIAYWNSDPAKEELTGRLLEYVNDTADDSIIKEVQEEFKEGDDQDFTHAIGNLCLLDAKTNRSYGNAPFPLKRKTIISRMGQGQFIPQGTQNIFLKVYSSNTSNMMFWNKQDAEDYMDCMITTLASLLGE